MSAIPAIHPLLTALVSPHVRHIAAHLAHSAHTGRLALNLHGVRATLLPPVWGPGRDEPGRSEGAVEAAASSMSAQRLRVLQEIVDGLAKPHIVRGLCRAFRNCALTAGYDPEHDDPELLREPQFRRIRSALRLARALQEDEAQTETGPAPNAERAQ